MFIFKRLFAGVVLLFVCRNNSEKIDGSILITEKEAMDS